LKKPVSRPHRPPRADGMGGAEFSAPEAGDTEVHPDRVHDIADHPKHPHGAHIDADPVVAAEVPVDVHLNGNCRGGRYLQIPSPIPLGPLGLSRMVGFREPRTLIFFHIKAIRFFSMLPLDEHPELISCSKGLEF